MANRGYKDDTESEGASTIAARERHERAVEARKAREEKYQQFIEQSETVGQDVKKEMESHAKLSNMYMEAMQAKMDELNSSES